MNHENRFKAAMRAIIEEGEPSGAAQHALAAVMGALAIPYGLGMAARSFAYRRGILNSYRLPRPVICVGNLTVGGTGKTPVALAVVSALEEAGLRPAILSRGYGATAPRNEPLIVSNGGGALAPTAQSGDEPALMARLAPRTPIVVGRDRHAAGMLAIERFDCGVLVLDDGFQHLRLRRDLDLVLLDSSRNPKALRQFPRGPRRESWAALRRAGAILLTRADQSDCLEHWRSVAARHAPSAPVFAVRFKASGLAPLGERPNPLPAETARGRKAFLASGVARPGQFRATVEALGACIAGERAFADHHAYALQDIHAIQAEASAAGAEWILTTDKDAVKWPAGERLPLPVFALRIEADFGGEYRRFLEIISKIRK